MSFELTFPLLPPAYVAANTPYCYVLFINPFNHLFLFNHPIPVIITFTTSFLWSQAVGGGCVRLFVMFEMPLISAKFAYKYININVV